MTFWKSRDARHAIFAERDWAWYDAWHCGVIIARATDLRRWVRLILRSDAAHIVRKRKASKA